MIEMRNINYGTKMQVEIILHVWNYWKGEDHDKQMITSSDVINLQKPKLQITRKDNFGQTTCSKHLKKKITPTDVNNLRMSKMQINWKSQFWTKILDLRTIHNTQQVRSQCTLKTDHSQLTAGLWSIIHDGNDNCTNRRNSTP